MPQLLPIPTSFSASANTALIEALWLLEERLAAWSSNQDAFNDLLQQVFGVQPGDTITADLQATISSGLGINLQILDARSINGLIAAYTSDSQDGGERIYLNHSWLELATAEQIEAVLLEELGHAIDHRLNGSSDSDGDEGAIFSALLRGVQVPAVEKTQKDQHILVINGQSIVVEAAAPVLDPSASPAMATIGNETDAPSGAAGTLVSALIDSGENFNNFTDADGDAPAIAIVDTNLQGGTLYFSTDNGLSWGDVGNVSANSARVLYADSNTRLAFVPDRHFHGDISDLITFKAWDRGIAENGASGIGISPKIIGSKDFPGWTVNITLSPDGNIAYLSTRSSGLRILDVSRPLVEKILTSTPWHDLSRSLSDGNTAFIADITTGLLRESVDVSDPSTSYKYRNILASSSYATGIAV